MISTANNSVDQVYDAYLKDPSQEDALYKALRTYAEAICKERLRRLDEDAIQEAILKVFQELSAYDKKKGKLSSWAYKVMWNRMQDVIVRGQKRLESPLGEARSLECLPDSSEEESRNKEAIAAALTKLDANKQAVVRLRLQNLSFEEIGAELGINTDTAEMRWRRALEELRDASR